MELSYVIIPLLALIAGLYLYSRLRSGNPEDSLRTMLGLRANESILYSWTGYYDMDRLDHSRGASITVALTNQHRLIIGNNDQKQMPIEYERGQLVGVEAVGKAESKTAESSQRAEPVKIIKIQPRIGKSFRIQIDPSALIELQAFVDPSTSS